MDERIRHFKLFFKKTPKADLEVNLKNNEKIRLEIQSGFQGINDIKQHKVIEAKRIFAEERISSLAIHFDLFNGQVAFVKLDNIEDDNILSKSYVPIVRIASADSDFVRNMSAGADESENGSYEKINEICQSKD